VIRQRQASFKCIKPNEIRAIVVRKIVFLFSQAIAKTQITFSRILNIFEIMSILTKPNHIGRKLAVFVNFEI